MLSHPGPDKNHVHLMEVTYLRCQVTLVFTAVTSKNDVTLCKVDVNVKNWTAVAGSVDFFKHEQKLLNVKSVTLKHVLL